jgi:hypothetical protein
VHIALGLVALVVTVVAGSALARRVDVPAPILLVALGALGGAGHGLLVLAFARAPAARLAPLTYLEIVGAAAVGYVAFGDFPDAPAWLNEGMGSLFEQCGERDGHIVGYTNWRLPGLQKAIREGRARPFKELTALSAGDFYSKETGTNYAQARYLCYYLQERGLLARYYREFLTNHAADPTGFDTLKRVLGIEDVNAFQKEWEKFILGLSEEIRLTPLTR